MVYNACRFCFVVIIQIVSKPFRDKRETASGNDRRYSGLMIGSIMLASDNSILIFDANARTILNQTFPHMKQRLPIKSGLNGFASMAVVNGVAYIGGFNGTIYLLKLPVESLSTEGSKLSEDANAEVNVSNITLPFHCIAEAFTYTTTNGVIAACFNNNNSILYIVNVHSPSEKRELQFTSKSDLSNILPVGEAFYFVQHNHLLRADITSTGGPTQVETLENCRQAQLMMNRYYYIVIHCKERSHVYVPLEWRKTSGMTPGMKYGAWKNSNVELKPCHGIGFALLVLSVNDATVTLYDPRNDFKTNIILPGDPNTIDLTCTWNGSYLTLMYNDETCNCWKEHQLSEQYLNVTSSIIPYSEGTLAPLVVDNRTISQGVLLFHPTYYLLPSARQVFLDLRKNVTHPMITEDVVVYHAGIYSQNPEPGINDEVTTDSGETSHTHWQVYTGVGVALALVLTVFGVVAYWQKSKIKKLRW